MARTLDPRSQPAYSGLPTPPSDAESATSSSSSSSSSSVSTPSTSSAGSGGYFQGKHAVSNVHCRIEEPVPCNDWMASARRSFKDTPMVGFTPAGIFVGDPCGNGALLSDCVPKRIRGSYDEVFAHERRKGIKKVMVVIFWPGYADPFKFHVPTMTVRGTVLLRWELAAIIAQQVRIFVEEFKDLSTDDDLWRLGTGGFAAEDISLSFIWSPKDGVYQLAPRVLKKY